jgi:hypothetical protein
VTIWQRVSFNFHRVYLSRKNAYTVAVKKPAFTTRQGLTILAIIMGGLILAFLLMIWTAPPIFVP